MSLARSFFYRSFGASPARAALVWAVIAFLLNQLLEFVVMSQQGRAYSDLCQWDCKWYTAIVQGGYDLEPHAHAKQDAANWAFFPAFPLLAKAFSVGLGVAPAASLVLASKLCFLAAIYAFVRLVTTLDARVKPPVAALVLGFSPYAIYGNVGYTESLFLLVSCCYFLALESKRFLLAGLLGGALGSVRVAGVAAIPAHVIALWGDFWRGGLDQRLRILLSVMLLPFGLSLFMWFLHVHTGDALAFSHIQLAWGRVPESPVGHFLAGLHGTAVNQLRVAMVIGVAAVIVWLLATRRYPMAIFSLICTVLPLTTGLWAIPRYIWWQAPVLFAIAVLISHRKLWVLYLPLSAAATAFIYTAWFTGKAFVV